MQTKRDRIENPMMLLPSLEAFIPEDYYLRRLNRVLDLSFVHELVADRYCQDNGRPSIDPEVVLRLFLLQAIEGISWATAVPACPEPGEGSAPSRVIPWLAYVLVHQLCSQSTPCPTACGAMSANPHFHPQPSVDSSSRPSV